MPRLWQRALRPLTLPLSWVYGAAVAMRNRGFDEQGKGSRRLPLPVVSVGNVTVGGSGKTPLVATIARHYLAGGMAPAVLSRGYRRQGKEPFVLASDGDELLATPTQAGDEPVELARAVPGLIVAVGADRYRVGRELLSRTSPGVMILDDGFQHRQLCRDLDIVCIDAREAVEELRLLPAGRLREPLTALSRADVLIWSGWKEGTPSEALASSLLHLRKEASVFRAVHRIAGFTRIDAEDERLAVDSFRNESVGLVLAIAKPSLVGAELREREVRIVFEAHRRDHHAWKPAELEALAERGRAKGASVILTTGKDAVKIRPLVASHLLKLPLPLYQLELEVEILEQEAFRALLDRVVKTQASL